MGKGIDWNPGLPAMFHLRDLQTKTELKENRF